MNETRRRYFGRDARSENALHANVYTFIPLINSRTLLLADTYGAPCSLLLTLPGYFLATTRESK